MASTKLQVRRVECCVSEIVSTCVLVLGLVVGRQAWVNSSFISRRLGPRPWVLSFLVSKLSLPRHASHFRLYPHTPATMSHTRAFLESISTTIGAWDGSSWGHYLNARVSKNYILV